MDVVTRDKWDRAAPGFDLMASYGPEKRWEPAKRKLFSNMGDGEILFLAVGTGLDVRFFPEGRKIPQDERGGCCWSHGQLSTK